MWLINTSTLKLEAFTSCPSGRYAILSHTWEDEELDFNTFKSGDGQGRKSYVKIERCCAQAKSHGLDFAWVDTVCIDKRSSTELSEAINSMFSWYANATVCYVYLADLSPEEPGSTSTLSDLMRDCRWFTRGWTLQELLAPRHVKLYTRDWTPIGTKQELASLLSIITGIDSNVLAGVKDVHTCSIAQRMSWASQRETTRIEDIAYCLLGVFAVNMPLLYEEGTKAFIRLQKAIIEISDDESIFAWTGVHQNGSGMLARSPQCFVESGDVMAATEGPGRSPYSMTNRGLAMQCDLLPYRMNIYITPLRCVRHREDSTHQRLGIYLCRADSDNQHRRIGVDGIDLPNLPEWESSEARTRQLYIPDGIHVALAPHGGLPILFFQPETPRVYDPHIPQVYNPQSSDDVTTENPSNKRDRQQGPLLPWGTRRWWAKTHQEDLENGTTDIIPFTAMATETSDVELVHRAVTMQDFAMGFRCFDSRLTITKSMKCGFNVDFEPMCVLHTSWIPSLAATRREMYISLLDPWKLFSHIADLLHPRSRDRHFSFLDQNMCNEVLSGQAIRNPAAPDFWILKGHRSEGLQVSVTAPSSYALYNSQLVISMRRAPTGEDNREDLVWLLKTQVVQTSKFIVFDFRTLVASIFLAVFFILAVRLPQFRLALLIFLVMNEISRIKVGGTRAWFHMYGRAWFSSSQSSD